MSLRALVAHILTMKSVSPKCAGGGRPHHWVPVVERRGEVRDGALCLGADPAQGTGGKPAHVVVVIAQSPT